MRKIISTILIIATVIILFSACNQTIGEQTTAPLVTQSNIPTDETIPSRTGITFSDIYNGTKSACQEKQIDDTISLLEPDGEAERFSFFMDTIGVVCKSENGYVVRATSMCYDKSMLETAYSTGSSGMLSLLQALTIPILELDKNLEQTHFITQLLGAYKYTSDNVNHSVLFIGDWLYSLSVPMSDEYIAVVAVYIGQQGNAEDSSAQVAASVWRDYQPGQWSMFEYTNEWLNMKFYSNGAFKAEELFITPTIKYANASRSDAPNRPFVEMLFRWSNTENKGTPITLTIEPITDANKTLQEYADEKIQILQNSFVEFGLSCKYIEKQEEDVTLFGEPYLQQYTKRNICGGIYKNYSYYSIKDNCLICLSFDAPSSLMNLDYFLSHFSALDGTGQEPSKICTQCGLDDSIATFTSGTTVCDACIYQNQNGQYGEKRVCSQCGQSEPDTIFTGDWKPGDICFGCSYDNFNVGENGKKYCSQCGSDCTYRGLEEDGRCEDCYFGD